ncbi:hypothetical protein T07_14337 [Trichinella nelsoni]|uniref:Uncharacterized protein n=1 Tax=Trichinella nelsoni TaxID=6336 RepID=A0A0V0SII5_9BILA|nr:hypothetical protein T07_14337 [Trichinella nelsoni]
MIHSRLYLYDMNSILPSMPLFASKPVPVVCCYASINKAVVLSVNLYPQTIICNFEIALIPLC